MLYFAYGSNMSRPRIEKRLGKVRVETTAILSGHRLAFDKAGRDGTGKCRFEKAGVDDRLHGVLFRVGDRQLAALDRAEGVGRGYDRVVMEVLAEGRTPVVAVTYEATALNPRLRPFSWYVKHVLYGAVDAALSKPYVDAIRRTRTVADPRRSREARELSVYRREDLVAKLGPER